MITWLNDQHKLNLNPSTLQLLFKDYNLPAHVPVNLTRTFWIKNDSKTLLPMKNVRKSPEFLWAGSPSVSLHGVNIPTFKTLRSVTFSCYYYFIFFNPQSCSCVACLTFSLVAGYNWLIKDYVIDIIVEFPFVYFSFFTVAITLLFYCWTCCCSFVWSWVWNKVEFIF